MDWIISVCVLLACGVGAKWAFKKARDVRKDQVIYGIIGLAALFAVQKFLNPVVNLYMILKSTFVSVTGASTVLGGVFGFGLIAFLFIGGPRAIIYLFGIASPWIKFLITATFAVSGTASALIIYGTEVDVMTYVYSMLVVATTISALYIIYFWRKGIQDTYAIIAGYLLNMGMTWALCWAIWGIGVQSNITGSLADILPFIVANVALLTITYILSLTVFFKKRFSYKVIYLWTICLVIFSFGWTLLVLTGYINKYELMVTRQVNQARKIENTIRRMMSLGTERAGLRYDEALTVLKIAEENGNFEGAKKARVSLEEQLWIQRTIPDVELETPQGTQRAFDAMKRTGGKLIPSFGSKEPPPPPQTKPEPYSESHSFMTQGDVWQTPTMYNPGTKLRLKVLGGDVEIRQTPDLYDTYSSGEYPITTIGKGYVTLRLKTKRPSLVSVSVDNG
jgi:hypothetical protein